MASVRISKDPIAYSRSPTMLDMKPGQLAIITDQHPATDEHRGVIVLCCSEGVVSKLCAPQERWLHASVEVRILPVGAEVTLTQEEA